MRLHKIYRRFFIKVGFRLFYWNPLFRFGFLTIEGSRVEEKAIYSLTFETGKPYRGDKLISLGPKSRNLTLKVVD